ncbi:MAG: DUF3098 domain-containing protein [Bacteroidia bacterium]
MNKNKETTPTTGKSQIRIPFVKQNYMFMAAGFLLVVIGFIFMYIKEADHGNSEVIYSFSKTTLPVVLIMIGFAVTGFGIMKRFNSEA